MLFQMGLEDDLKTLGHADVEAGNHTQQPDHSYQPKVLPYGRSSKWPSVVIETGFAEQKTHLVKKTQWWIHQSEGDVRAVITISVNQKVREIILDHWHPVNRPTRGVPSRMVAESTQQVVISQGAGDDASIKVENAPFVVPFSSFFLREPLPGKEADFRWTKEQLETLGKNVWEDHPRSRTTGSKVA
ncbi:hypothetical protein ASPZODRAFT_18675 [Penicilliopsis zonata CBS 506.65]|uniref:Uncharacterized protein n=1 Tax=Penicilliopsis zonata CBS 506.65 TaxID=1073090 RepID=A0A1L9SBC7_9EURO|nr:hypothetical protein ASPZODRAFT_18675 [Penicilliopsis zonata CBS 506.65]OJJ44485.1 hypothetical protein ASPZODRAFT_18675 [Penicilliopsis zonata CBS 506.65]